MHQLLMRKLSIFSLTNIGHAKDENTISYIYSFLTYTLVTIFVSITVLDELSRQPNAPQDHRGDRLHSFFEL